MLILPHADRLRIDLDKLRQRVLQAPADADCAPDGHVKVWKLFYCNLAGGIDRSAGFVHNHLDGFRFERLNRFSDEFLRLAACGPVADGDQANRMLLEELPHCGCCPVPLPLRLMRVHSMILKELAGPVNDRNLAPRPEAGIDGKRWLCPGGRGEQEFPEVCLKCLNGIDIGCLLFEEAYLADQRCPHESFIGVFQHCPEKVPHGRGGGHDFPRFHERLDKRLIKLDVKDDFPLFLPAAQGEHVVRLDVFHTDPVVPVHLEFGRPRKELILDT